MIDPIVANHSRAIACIDLEGVLVPELWPFIAEETGIPELAVTTREEPDYPTLVEKRITLLKTHQYSAISIVKMMQSLDVLPGALEFLKSLRKSYEILIVSDAFTPMINPFLEKLETPKIECNTLIENDQGYFNNAVYIRPRGKESTIENFKALGYRVVAVGDALNDLGMLRAASSGFLFNPSEATKAVAPDVQTAYEYKEILETLKASYEFDE